MSNLHTTSELELGRFGEFLLRSRIVPGKYARYYVQWVRRFFAQVPDRPGVTLEDWTAFRPCWSNGEPQNR